jgi:hypothetical protein
MDAEIHRLEPLQDWAGKFSLGYEESFVAHTLINLLPVSGHWVAHSPD